MASIAQLQSIRTKDRIQEPGMALLVLRNYAVKDGIQCFGARINPRSIVSLELHSAYVIPETGQIKPDQLLLRLRMSDLQFGRVISRPSYNDGFPVTLEVVEGLPVVLTDDDNRYLMQGIRNNLERMASPAHQSDENLRAVEALLKSADEGAVIAAGEWREALRGFSLTVPHARGNHAYAAEVLEKELRRRANEAVDVVHHAISDSISMRPALPPAESDLSVHPYSSARGLMSVHFTTGMCNLFDEPMSSWDNGFVSIDFCEADADCDGGDGAPSRMRGIKGLSVSLAISETQYARLLRADACEVPCTLRRYQGGVQPLTYRGDIEGLLAEGRADADSDITELVGHGKTLADTLAAVNIRTAKGRRQAQDAIAAYRAAVQPLLAQCSERAGQHASSIAGAHQQRLKAQVEREVLRLANSNEIRDVLLQILPEAFGD